MPQVARAGGGGEQRQYEEGGVVVCQLVVCWVGSPPAVVMVGWPTPLLSVLARVVVLWPTGLNKT